MHYGVKALLATPELSMIRSTERRGSKERYAKLR
jgi:hypothetical protein